MKHYQHHDEESCHVCQDARVHCGTHGGDTDVRVGRILTHQMLRIASALERIADAQERAHPKTRTPTKQVARIVVHQERN